MQNNHRRTEHCFHCALPIMLKSPPEMVVTGQKQQFCCHGCQAVCEAIVNSGNADFYKHRNVAAPNMQSRDMSALLEKLKIYDKPEIQSDFVRSGQHWKEAYIILEEIRCAACLWLNERTIRNLEGVLDVTVDYTSQQAVVRWNPEELQLSDILSAISRIGYIAHPFDPSHREALNAELKQRSVKRLIVTSLLGMMVMQIAIGSYFFGQPDAQGEYPLWISLSRWSNLILTAVILAYSGQLFFSNAWRDLKNKTLGMDVPVVLGLSVAWIGSLVSTISGKGEVYFESIAMFVTFLLFARYAEIRARITATDLLDRTAKIIPQSVDCKKDGAIKQVAVIELTVGDIICIRPGEAVPVDAMLLSEGSSFDESLLNGESRPVSYRQGDTVAGGSINIDQAIELKVMTTSDRSTLSQLQQLTQSSVKDRPYYIDIADRVAGKFVAVILLIAAATYAVWTYYDPARALEHSIAVLIITCPCALALAAPVSLSLCAAGLSRLHVIALRLSVIEKLATIDCTVFDKTGTLTTGIPELKAMLLIGGADKNLDEESLLSIAAEIEQGSEHPFAKAIRSKAGSMDETAEQAGGKMKKRLDFSIGDLKNFSGQGIEALVEIEGSHSYWRLGSERFVSHDKSEEGDDWNIPEQYRQKIGQWRKNNGSVVFLGDAEKILAVFFVHDPLRGGVEQFVKEQAVGSRCVILSGDHPDSVAAVANRLGIDEAYGGLLPAEKLRWVRQKQQQGSDVLMLGDGINDAPTLAAANVSATFASATDFAKNHSDLLILRKDFLQLSEVLAYMKKTRSIIIQNLSWAICYNVLAVPAAALGWVTPWIAAIGMSLSSLLVVLNSLRLKNL